MSRTYHAACWLGLLAWIGIGLVGCGSAEPPETAMAPPSATTSPVQQEQMPIQAAPPQVASDAWPEPQASPVHSGNGPLTGGLASARDPFGSAAATDPGESAPALTPPALTAPSLTPPISDAFPPEETAPEAYSTQRPQVPGTNEPSSASAAESQMPRIPSAPLKKVTSPTEPRFIEQAPSQQIGSRIAPSSTTTTENEPSRLPAIPYGGFSQPRDFTRTPSLDQGAANPQPAAAPLPPIMSLDALPRPRKGSSARVAIADSTKAAGPLPTPIGSFTPSGGSAPPTEPATHSIRRSTDSQLTLRQDVADIAPPVPVLAEAIPPSPSLASLAIGASGSSSGPLRDRFVPKMNFNMAAMGSMTLPERNIQPQAAPSIDYQIAPLIPSAAERIKGDFETVEVFYGTDRHPDGFDGESPLVIILRFLPALSMALITTLLVGFTLYRPRWQLWVGTGVAGVLALGLAAYAGNVTAYNARTLAKDGPRYGVGRDELQVGVCHVSIPKIHLPGMLEAPSITRLEISEDVRKHLILQDVKPMQSEDFYERLRSRVNNSANRELFIFVHGYNVTFEDAARRTAQMHFDLNYAGAPIFYSWPSQGELWKYTVDETNISWTAPHFKQFVRDIIAHSDARSINLIAHSMGNRAMTSALRDIALEMRDNQKVFNQVVLAAPDIDAEVFKQDIAPYLQKTAENVTLYASSNDQALIASKLVHGYPRAGESGTNLVVLDGVVTIDVSSVETNFLGHSYYGDSDIILADICRLLTDAPPPTERHWLAPALANGNLTYWVFLNARAASAMPREMR